MAESETFQKREYFAFSDNFTYSVRDKGYASFVCVLACAATLTRNKTLARIMRYG